MVQMMTTNVGNTPTVVSWQRATLDASNAQELKAQMNQLAGSTRQVVLDLRGTEFVDSTGLGVLIFSLKRLREKGGDLSLCIAQQQVRKLLAMLRMHRLFRIFNEPAEALRRFAAEAHQELPSGSIAAATRSKTDLPEKISHGE